MGEEKIYEMIEQWRKEAGITFPTDYDLDEVEKKVTLYTKRHGCYNGRFGCLLEKYSQMLKDSNGIEKVDFREKRIA